VTIKTIRALRDDFKAGRIAKPAYIDAMNENHRLLHDYAEHLADTDVEAIELRGGEVTMTMRATGIKLTCQRDDKRAAPLEILNFGRLEAEEADATRRLVRDGDTVFDIGANMGWYSLTLAALFKRLAVHAFEPVPATFARLQKHVALNGLGRRVHLHRFGFSDQRGDFSFFFDPKNSVNASGADLGGKGRKVRCRLETLDEFARRRRVDFIKCDVEGGELLVFRGGMKTLARDYPVIFTEMLRKWSAAFGYHPNDIIDLLAKLGYRPFVARNGRLRPFSRMDETTVDTNFFFAHPQKHAFRLRKLL
jgi:FkbM family methyltransferase